MSSESLNGVKFPFSAVIGMDDAKRAIECVLVNPHLKSVLIRGPSGVAKTTVARAIGSISDKKILNIPLNVTEEQLFGGMDIESTLSSGETKVNPGLLQNADGCIIYIDDVNLMDQAMLISIMEAVDKKKVILEREGISASYNVDTTVIASMNPEDTDLSSHLLDRFDMCAYAVMSEDDGEKKEILRRNMEYIKSPADFVQKYFSEDEDIRNKIEKAEKIYPFVTVSDELVDIVVELCTKIGAAGHRGDIATINTAKALAALNGRDEVMKKDVEEAAALCLTHRRNYSPPPPEPPEPPEQEEEPPPENDDEDNNEDNEQKEEENPPEENEEEPSVPEPPDLESLMEEMLFNIGEQFKVIDYLEDGVPKRIRRTKSRAGRRTLVESDDKTGRYAKSRMPTDKYPDIAFDATIRAAAPYQLSREHDGLSISIEKRDIREKVRERRSGCTILFLVDASGSLGVRKRMVTVKGAIMSMLKESYVKRDRIGMMAFRRDTSELILPPTKSVEYSYKKLEELPTGGKTPLGTALMDVSTFMSVYSRSHVGEACFIVLITDGRANVPVDSGADPNEEVQKIAEGIKLPGVRWIIIDAATGFARFDHAKILAKKLEGTYFKLDELNADRLAQSVKSVVGNET